MLEKLAAAHKAGKLRFFGELAHLASADAFAAFLAPLRTTKWFVYSKRPFSSPKTVLAYLSRYTHRVAISNRRLIAADKTGVTFKYKDYRIEGPGRFKAMTLETGEFIRRFLTHVLPRGFHRIRHYGLLASGVRADNLATIRILLAMDAPASNKKDAGKADAPAPGQPARNCPCCGGRMLIVETFEGSCRRGEGRPRLPLRPTRHEQDCARLHPNRWQPPPPLSGRLRRRLSGGSSLRPFWALRCGCVQVPALVNSPCYAPPPYLLMLQMPAAACLRADGRGEILIALCSSGCPASRGFLPRGLSKRRPSRLWWGSAWAAFESLHKSGLGGFFAIPRAPRQLRDRNAGPSPKRPQMPLPFHWSACRDFIITSLALSLDYLNILWHIPITPLMFC